MTKVFLQMIAAIGIIMSGVSVGLLPAVSADNNLPKVQLNTEKLAPRPIEDRTSEVVPRDYAHAWQNMVEALDQNRTDLLDGYFTGFAKDNLSKLIADQKRTGIRVRYVDRGHKLDALFYAPAGDAMQLRDHAQLEVQILDGSRVIHSEQLTQNYLVLMTPGADRWLVRDLESEPAR